MPKPTNDITIGTVLWDLHVNDLSSAAMWQDIASDFSHRELLTILENVLAEYNNYDRSITIDRIELEIESINNQGELEEKLRMALKQVITKDLTTSPLMQEAILKSQALSWSALQQLQYYFINGYLPWNASASLFADRTALYEAIYQLDSKTLREWLFTTASEQKTQIRFLNFFSDHEVEQLMGYAGLLRSSLRSFLELINELITHIDGSAKNIFYMSHLGRWHFKVALDSISQDNSVTEESLVSAWWQLVVKEFQINNLPIHQLQEAVNAWCASPGGSERREHSSAPALLARIIIAPKIDVSSLAFNGSSLDASAATRPLPRTKDNDLPPQKTFFISNAGIVLLYPYLRRFFKEVNLLGDDLDFFDRRSQMLACYHLEFAASGREEVKEYDLVLNKILCGYPLNEDAFLISAEDISDGSKETINTFLKQVIEGWEKVRTTSTEGFRNSFIQRQGKLTEEDSNWLLIVERKGWDVLLDTLPYPISIIKLPWMTKPLFVQW
jgi:hypothetical protein